MGNLQATRSFFTVVEFDWSHSTISSNSFNHSAQTGDHFICTQVELNLMIFSISKVDCLRLSVDLVSYLNLIFLKNSDAILL